MEFYNCLIEEINDTKKLMECVKEDDKRVEVMKLYLRFLRNKIIQYQ